MTDFHLVAIQEYETYVNQAHVIRGNDVIVKCDIPSFVTDFVQVVSWQDNEENAFQANSVNSQGNHSNSIRALRIKSWSGGKQMRKTNTWNFKTFTKLNTHYRDFND